MNVFVVENSAATDNGLQSLLSGISGVTIVGHSSNEQDAFEHIDALLPDAVILDASPQTGIGIGVLGNVKKYHPEIKVMVLADCPGEFHANRRKYVEADYFFDKSFQFAKARAAFWQWIYADYLDSRLRSKKS